MIDISATPGLRSKLPELAQDGAVVIDYFASARCGVCVGDITADIKPMPSPETHPRVAAIDGVPICVERRLEHLLERTAASLDLRRLPFGPRLSITLTPPERWLEFLEQPGILRRPSLSKR